MKRFLSLIVAVSAIFAAMAQNPMVTLSHNGELTFFTNLNAFNAALEAAENGDILYLSEGDFILDGGSCTIKKRLSIRGSGYKSHLLGRIQIDMGNNPNSWIEDPLFDGVRLDDLTFASGSWTRPANLSGYEIRRSRIRKVQTAGEADNNITYDKCYIDEIDFRGGNSNTTNILVKNSKIGSCLDYTSTITLINCNINTMSELPRYMISSILNQDGQPGNNYNYNISNSLLRFTPEGGNVNECYINEALLLDDNLEAKVGLTDYRGQDGTVVGIHGGESPFSENPSVPTVDSSKSTVEYDAAGNKLKVSITVKAD